MSREDKEKLNKAKEFCERLKRLDKQFKTPNFSPLHHNNRCSLCLKEE